MNFIGANDIRGDIPGAEVASQTTLLRDLASARRIQQGLLPRAWTNAAGLDLAGACRSAHEIGGDFYDVVPLPNQDSVLLVVADVMGKSVPAALFSSTLRALIRTVSPAYAEPGQILLRLNELLIEDLDSVDMFITVQLGLANLATRELLVASAGHCPLLVCSRAGRAAFVPASGLPLGVSRDSTYESQRLSFADCSPAIFYTDGIIETRNPSGELLGCEGLERIVGLCPPGSSAAVTKEFILAEVARFEAGVVPDDDQTLLAATWDLTPPPSDPY